MDGNCPRSADQSFGPAVVCPHVFDFTLLFEQSIFSIGPSVLFLLLVPLRILNLYGKTVKTTKLINNVLWLKFTFAASLLGTQIAILILWARDNTVRTAAPSAILSLLDVLFITVLSAIEHSRSVRPSTLICVYLLVSILLDSVQVRTLFLRSYYSPALAGMVAGAVGLKTILLSIETQHKGKYLRFKQYPPEELSGVFARTVFSWLNQLFFRGFRKILTLDDLFPTDSELGSDLLLRALKFHWVKYKSRNTLSIIYATVSCLRWALLQLVPPRVCLIGFSYAQTLFIERALTILNEPVTQDSKNDGYGLIGAAALIYGGIAISTVHYQRRLVRLITMFRGAFVALIYDYTMTLREGQYDESAVITHMSTDIDMVARSLEQINELWARVLEVAIGIWLLERQLGAVCIAPVLVIISCTSLQTYMATFMSARQKLWMGAIEQRISIISTSLRSIKSIKMLGFSDHLGDLLQAHRLRELDLSRKFRWLIVWLNVVASLPQLCAPLVTFAAFIIRSRIDGSEPLSTAQAFTSLAIINLITSPALQLLASIPALTASMAAFDRVHRFLTCSTSDKEVDQTSKTPPFQNSSVLPTPDGKGADQAFTSDTEMDTIRVEKRPNRASPISSDMPVLTVSKAYIRPSPTSDFCLQNINMIIKPGKITIITGPVGCGKSILLKAVMGEVVCEQGYISVYADKGIAFCGQTPWLQNTTIRNNICGYSGCNHLNWYREVLHACALEDDLVMISNGDESLVGSEGITLSGGQKQRIALARALYSKQPLLVLDGVLSAVDQHTEQIILERVFGSKGLCRNAGISVLMTTHSKKYFALADEVLVLNAQGHVVKQGPFEPTLLADQATEIEESGSVESCNSDSFPKGKVVAVPKTVTPEIISDMARQTGDIAVYSYYLRAIGWRLVLWACLIIFVYTFSANFPQVWLDIFTNDDDQPGRFIGVYVLLAVAASGSQGLMIWQIMINIVVRSGLALHGILVHSVMNAPMHVFAEVDIGVILNRFSQDMTLVDAVLPTVTFGTLLGAAQCLAQAALISLGSSYMAITIIPTLVVLYVAQKIYLRTSRQIRFLDLEAKSPLYTHFAETLTGLSTIRGFGWQTKFLEECLRRLDISQRPYYLLFCIQRWLNVVLDLMVAILAIILTALATSLRGSTDAGKLGISLTAIMAFNQSLQELVTSWTAMETSLGAIARTRSFQLDTASEHRPGEDFVPPSEWPSHGKVDIQAVSTSYDGVRNVLENINVTIDGGERIAICGRTGSGKSTFLSLLLRLIDHKAGSIRIDDIDITTIPRNVLRSRLIVIPQDPLPALPGCSIRLNLDPNGNAPDRVILSALERVGLHDLVESRGGLNGEDLSSQPLSQGQQRLFALARAMVSKWTRDAATCGLGGILILDEFTGSTDPETERSMLKIIEDEFAGYTIIHITHQIEAVREMSDRIMNLVSGRFI